LDLFFGCKFWYTCLNFSETPIWKIPILLVFLSVCIKKQILLDQNTCIWS
jgi:hypothetical protein